MHELPEVVLAVWKLWLPDKFKQKYFSEKVFTATRCLQME